MQIIKPLADKVLVRRAGSIEKTSGGILIPEVAQEETQYGTVIAAGPGKINSKGIREKMSVRPGDRVYFTKNAVIEVEHNGSEHLMMKEERVLLIEDHSNRAAKDV